MYVETFTLSETTKEISRETYDLLGVFGYVGGVWSFFIGIGSLIVVPYSQLSF